MRARLYPRYRHRRQHGTIHSSVGISHALAAVYYQINKTNPALAEEFKQGVISLKAEKGGRKL